jgi:hypothetical protein
VRYTYGAGAAAVVAGLLPDSVDFRDFRYGEMAAAGEEEEKVCEHEGRLLDKDRIALVDGLKGTIFVAMVCE